MRFLICYLLFVSTAFAIKPDGDYHAMLNRRISQPAEFKKFISRYDLLKKHKQALLKPKSEYEKLRIINVDKLESTFAKDAKDFLDFFYERIEQKINFELGSYYYRKGTSKRVILYVPVPHFGNPPDNRNFIKALMSEFPDDHFIYMDNQRAVIGSRVFTLQEMQKNVETEIAEIFEKLKLQDMFKVVYVSCYGTPFIFDFLSRRHDLYDKVVFYSPMVKEIIPNLMPDTRFIYPGEKTFPLSDIFFSYFNILQGMDHVIPTYFPVGRDQVNISPFSTLYRLYRDGLAIEKIKNKYAVLTENDEIIPNANSRPELFKSVYIIKESTHINSVFKEDKITEHMTVLRKFIEKPDR